MKYQCETCHDTGFYGDNGPGIKGNGEYVACECPAGYGKESDVRDMRIAELEQRCGEMAAAAQAFQELTVCYRLNKQPSEKLFKRLEKGRKILAKCEES